MWNETSIELAESKLTSDSVGTQPKPAVIECVEPHSIGDELGFEPGDQLIKINGVKPRDLIDYNFLIVEEELTIELMDKEGKLHKISFEKDLDDSLGLSFTESLFDGLKQCNNHCPFCFIDQQPPGKRNSLYLKDDDYRLSFLYGSYLTLTNLTSSDWRRIEKQRLSPLFVSVHATDPTLRVELLKNPRAGQLLEQLKWFCERDLQIHAQVVVCPGINDGEVLDQTLQDLASHSKGQWPVVLSVAVVPVGLTRFRPPEDGLKPVDLNCAKQVINQVEQLQTQFLQDLDSRFVWLSDEWYLLAKQPLPTRQAYEDLPQQENGVGSIQAFLETLDIATKNLPVKIDQPRKCSWVVGKLVKEALTPACNRLNKVEGLTLLLHGIRSTYWGQEEVVTGLLTGADLIKELKERELGDHLLIPSIMLKQNQDVFLDDMTLGEVSQRLSISVKVVHGADDIVAAAIGDSRKNSLSSAQF